MSGPALNPLANIVPVTPSKGVDTPSGDNGGLQQSDGPEAPAFASELKRQMSADGNKDASSSKGSAAPKGEEGPASTAGPSPDTAPPPTDQPPNFTPVTGVTPEMAALLAGLQPGTALAGAGSGIITNTAAGDKLSGKDKELADDDASLPGADAQAGLQGLASAILSQTSSPSGGKAGAGAAEEHASTAKFAASQAKADSAWLGGKESGTVAEIAARSADSPMAPAQPTNSFAAIHAAALANLQPQAAHSATAPVPLHVATPASSPQWPEDVGNRVSWMVNNSESHAELTLTPPQLGKVEVSITVSGDQTSAQFVAATPAARDLIEQSLPRLREILEQSGISLGQTDVGTSSQSSQSSGDSEGGRRQGGWGQSARSEEGLITGTTAPQWSRRGDGLVDTFA